MSELEQITNLINTKNKFIAVTHKNPDGDAVGSLLGLTLFLERQGKQVQPLCVDEIPPTFSFLPTVERIKRELSENHLANLDVIFMIDCADLRRCGMELIPTEVVVVNIDHHPTNPSFGKINLVKPELTSTAEIIYNYLKELESDLGELIDKDVATCLLTGLYTDTGSFMHSNTTPQSLNIAADLIKQGARLSKITLNIRLKTVGALRLWGRVLSRVKRDREMGIITSIITRADVEEVKASEADLSGVVNLINTIPGTKAAILLSERKPGEIKGSIRTEDDAVDVSELASVLGGGGHRKAAGFYIKGELIKDGDDWKIE